MAFVSDRRVVPRGDRTSGATFGRRRTTSPTTRSAPAAFAALAASAATDDAELEAGLSGAFAAADAVVAFPGAALSVAGAGRPRRLAKIAGQRLVVDRLERDA